MKASIVKPYLEKCMQHVVLARLQPEDRMKLLFQVNQIITLKDDDNAIPALFRLYYLMSTSSNLISLVNHLLRGMHQTRYYLQLGCMLAKEAALTLENFNRIIMLSDGRRSYLFTLLYLRQMNNVKMKKDEIDLYFRAAEWNGTGPSPDMIEVYEATDYDELREITTNLNVMRILATLKWYDLTDVIDINVLNAMKPYQLSYFEEKLEAFCAFHCVSRPALKLLYEKITTKLPAVTKAKAVKQSRDLFCLPRSKLIVTTADGQCTEIYLQHEAGNASDEERYLSGSYGLVKQGYVDADARMTRWAVKIYHKNANNLAVSDACHEAKYYQLLGHQACFFSRGSKHYLVTDWLSGVTLDKIDRQQLITLSFVDRLRCLLTVLYDLQRMHAHHRIHGDIKRNNVVVNLATRTIRLIDFGLAHKNYHKKIYGCAKEGSDGYSVSTTFCDDVFSMGRLLPYLFPDHFVRSPLREWYVSMLPEFSASKQVLSHLYEKMCLQPRDNRTTVTRAIEFCEKVVAEFAVLNSERVSGLHTAVFSRQLEPELVMIGKARVGFG